MKNVLKAVTVIMVLAAGPTSAEAADHADLSTNELVQQRSQMRELAPDSHESYRAEMQSRMQSMNSDERALYRELNGSGGQGTGAKKMNRYGQGSGNGSGNIHRYGQGGGHGGGRRGK